MSKNIQRVIAYENPPKSSGTLQQNNKKIQQVVAKELKDEVDNDTPKIKLINGSQKTKMLDARMALKLDQKKMAELIGINHNIYKKYESGEAIFQPSEWTKINNTIDRLLKNKP